MNRSPLKKTTNHLEPVTVEEICSAEIEIIRAVQLEAFQRDLSLLRTTKSNQDKDKRTPKKRSIMKTSSIRRLDPFVDPDGILRVGGRIQYADVPYYEKHPLILPKKGHVTELVIRHHHERCQHQGRGVTHARIRSSGMWIVNGGSSVSRHIANCVTCRRCQGPPLTQKMANLPEDRVQASPPFTYCAVDYFGPFYIKEGRRELKRYFRSQSKELLTLLIYSSPDGVNNSRTVSEG